MKSFFKYTPLVGIKSFFKATPRLARVLSILAFATLISLGEFLVIAPKPALAAGSRVSICHRTKSASNPYRSITISNNALNGHGNTSHSGPVFGTDSTSDGDGETWGDIIPTDTPGDGLQYWTGSPTFGNKDKNWTAEGKSFFNGANASKCSRMTAARFVQISRAAGVSDADIATDLNEQKANEDALLGIFSAAGLDAQVGAISTTTNPATGIGTTSATLNGTISNSTGGSVTPKFEYGTSSTLATLDGGGTVSGGSASISTTITAVASLSLTIGLTYYYRVIGETGSEDTFGTFYGAILSFTTGTSRTLTIDSSSYSGSPYARSATPPTIMSTASTGVGDKSYSSSTTGVCTVDASSGVVTFVAAGTCTIAASISASGGDASANASAISFEITANSRTLTIPSVSASYALNATPPTITSSTNNSTDASGTKSYSSSTTGVCTVNSSSGVVAFVSTGTCTIAASISASGSDALANASSISFEITANSRTLTIPSVSASYALNATPPTITSSTNNSTDASGTKSYSSSTTGVCTVNSSSGVVAFVSTGTCTIAASISASGSDALANASSISFTITANPTPGQSPQATTPTTISPATVAVTTTTAVARNSNVILSGRKISICHATSSATNPYVLINVDRNSLNGHGDHSGDIIPAPAGGCPSTLISQIATTTTSTPAGRITICHATAAGTYVQITVNKSSLNGHEDHLDDMIPAPSGGCPYSVRQYALQLANTTTSVAPGIGSVTTAPRAPAGKITICHATAAGFYVELTVDRNGLNGHDGHDGDILSAPAEGCPRGVSKQSTPKTATTVPAGKISICHATAAGIYVSLTVDRSGLNGHGDHDGDLFVVPSDGCPSRVSALSTRDTMPKLTAGKIGICHARPDKSLKYMEVDQDTFDGHDEHEQDILPAPARGCPSPSSTIDLPLSIACINAREINNLDESNSSLTEGVEVSATKSESESEDDLGSIKLSGSDVGPALTLLSAESVDPEFEIIVKSSGVDYNKPTTWVNEGYGTYCWKLEPFGDRDYIYTLPDPASPPDARYAGLAYSTVIVKAGSITTTDPNYQVNTLFYEPSPGSGVFADVNKNGISDPGGQGGGTLGDKSISHVVVCVGGQSSIAKAPATTLPTSSTVGALQTTTTTINWSADFCPEPSSSTTSIAGGVSEPTSTSSTTTTIAGDSTTSSTTTTIAGGSTSTSTTIAGGSTSTSTTIAGDSTTSTTASPSTTLVTTTTPPGGSEDPNPPIEIVVRALKASSIGTTDLVLTLSDGVTSEVVFLKLNVKNFSVVETSLPATGQERWSVEQQLGWLLFITGALLGIIEIRRRETLRR